MHDGIGDHTGRLIRRQRGKLVVDRGRAIIGVLTNAMCTVVNRTRTVSACKRITQAVQRGLAGDGVPIAARVLHRRLEETLTICPKWRSRIWDNL